MLGQLALVVLAAAVCVAYLARRAWKMWTAEGGCAGGCGCAAMKKKTEAGLIGVEELMGRVRGR